jgi:hypothetical protein
LPSKAKWRPNTRIIPPAAHPADPSQELHRGSGWFNDAKGVHILGEDDEQTSNCHVCVGIPAGNANWMLSFVVAKTDANNGGASPE